MLSAVVLPERGAMNAVMVSSQDANRAGPRPDGRLRSPSSSPVSAAGSARGLAPASDGRSLMAVFAAGTGVSGVICGLTASAATGSPGRGVRAAMIRHATVPAVTAAPASATAITTTRMVGVPGHAWLVRHRARLMTQRSLNGGTCPPDSAAASRAASQASQAAAASAPADQQHDPDPGAVACQDRHPRGGCPAHGRTSAASPGPQRQTGRRCPAARSGALWRAGPRTAAGRRHAALIVTAPSPGRRGGG